jgi:chemotaxis methyl-accepting protein methylase
MVLARQLGRVTCFEVRGLDLSEAKLSEARTGRYARKSFHADEPAPLGIDIDDYLSREFDGSFTVRTFLRERVSFDRGNLAHPSTLRGLGEFDVVFCRNVLIYADEEAAARFFASLAALVRTDGYLFLGHSDGLNGPAAPFRLTRIGDMFAYVRRA